jgi:hypothetical protein
VEVTPARGAAPGRRRGLVAPGAIAVAAMLLLSPLGCDRVQTALSGKKDQGPELAALRKQIADFRARFHSAVQEGRTGDVGAIFDDGGRLLDAIETQAGKMSLMDGQSVKLQVASARNLMKDAQPFIESGDVDGVRAAQQKLDQALFEIDSILDRATMMTDSPQKTGS